MNILRDIKTAVKLIGEIRKAEKKGASAVQIKLVYTVPCVTFGPAYANTIEFGLTWTLSRDTDLAMRKVFKDLPRETQRWLEFTPEGPGAWVERARFWQRELRPVLPPKSYHAIMVLFVNWYAHCLRMRKEAAA